MINGTHTVIYSKDAKADRAFLKDTIGFSGVDVGDGWLIFALPPSEVAIHPAENNNGYGFFLMCDDINTFASEMGLKNVACSEIQEEPWGLLVDITLPSGVKLGVYEPLHARPN